VLLPIDSGWLPVVIFFARILDVSLGTLRTISVVRGRVFLASVLGFCEVSIWIVVITKVMESLGNPWNMLGWSLGFASGNAVGIMIERRLALGHLVIRVLSRDTTDTVAGSIRDLGEKVTEFVGHDPSGPVKLLYTVSDRSRAPRIEAAARVADPQCIVVTEDARTYSREIRPVATPRTGWRSVAKKK
jgi:uncharacterized protein YebE (UPF0316 family)